MIDRLLHRALMGGEAALAREVQRQATARAALLSHGDPGRAATRLRCRPGSDRIILGRAQDAGGRTYWAGLPVFDFMRHLWTTGATGSGKSRWGMAILYQFFSLAVQCALILIDFKSEFAHALLDRLIPAAYVRGGNPHLLDQIRVIRIGDPDLIPFLRVTNPEPGMSREAHAQGLAASLEDVFSEELRHRMNRIVLRLLMLAVELREPLPTLLTWLEDSAALLRAARRSTDPDLRRYLLTTYEQESVESRRALAARLDTCFMVPEIRLALSAPSCVSVPDMLEGGISVIDAGPRSGIPDRATRLVGRLFMGRLSRAILARPVTEQSPPVIVLADEFQEGLSSGEVAQLGRLLALARFRKTALWLVHQDRSQLTAVDSSLPKILATNCSLRAVFRANSDDANSLEFALRR